MSNLDGVLKINRNENIPTPGKEMLAAMKKAVTFEDFVTAIDENAPLKSGDGKVYSADELIDKAEKIRKQEARLDSIVNDSCIRDRLNEIIITEKVAEANSLRQLKEELGYLYNMGACVISSDGHANTIEEICKVIDSGIIGAVTRKYGLRDKIMSFQKTN